MAAIDPTTLKASELAAAVNRGELRAGSVADHYLNRVETLHPLFNCHIHWDKAEVRNELEKQIDAIEVARYAKKYLPLAGVPISIKDNIMVEGQIAACASRLLAPHRAAYDATVIQKLKAAGALLIGRTNMDEFAMGSSNENSAFGPVHNPWNRRHVAGGSSGGSAAAVAGSLVPLALGSDTGGSIRQPASFCGVYGLKPTYGRVSRYGLVAFGSSLDQIGPLARNVEDLALLYDVLAGPDGRDSTASQRVPLPTQLALPSGNLKGLRVATIREFMGEGLDSEVRKSLESALETMRQLGAETVEVSLPHLAASIPVYYILATAEASSNLARFDGVRYGARSQKPGLNLKEMYLQTRSEGFGREVKQRIMLGTYVLSAGYYDAYYNRAARMREVIKREMEGVFEKEGVHVLVSPTAPTTAFELGQKTQDSLSMYLSDVYTLAANLAGIPAMSQPMGKDSKGLPIGLQLMGPSFAEERLLQVAYQFERHQPPMGVPDLIPSQL